MQGGENKNVIKIPETQKSKNFCQFSVRLPG